MESFTLSIVYYFFPAFIFISRHTNANNMKKLLLSAWLIAMLNNLLSAQAPQQLNYQAVVRNNTGNTVANNTPVKLKFTIHDSSASGTSVFTETQNTTANQFGLVNVQIGSVSNLSPVNWGSGTKFLQVELDINNSGTYTDMGTSQLLSVPYALNAKTSADNNWVKSGNDIYNANSGNVGIGTVASFYKLHVIDSVGGHIAGVKIENKGDGGLATLVWGNKAGSTGLAAKWSGDTNTAYNVQTANMLSIENYNGNLMLNAAGNNIYLGTNNGEPSLTLTSTGNLGVGTTTPAPSAAVDITSTTGGLLLPRLTQAQRDALNNPVAGLVIFNSTAKAFQGYNGDMDSTLAYSTVGLTGTYVMDDGNMQDYPAQSFQPAVSGTCDSISFWVELFYNGFTQGDADVMLYSGLPDGSIAGSLLASTTLTINSLGKKTIAFANPPVLTAGVDYYFMIKPHTVYPTGWFSVERSNGATPGECATGTVWYNMGGMGGWMPSGIDDLQFTVLHKGTPWVIFH